MKHSKRIQEIIDNQGKTEAKIIKLFKEQQEEFIKLENEMQKILMDLI